MTNEKNVSNVIKLDSGRAKANKQDVFLSLASQIIADHATTGDEGIQRLVGDGNLQFSYDPAVRQSINGNGNIQISSGDPSLEKRLSALEKRLKKIQRVRDTLCGSVELKKK